MADFRNALGVPERDKNEEKETDSARVTGNLRPLTKDKEQKFSERYDASKFTRIHRRKRKLPVKPKLKTSDFETAEIFDSSSSEEEEIQAPKYIPKHKKVGTKLETIQFDGSLQPPPTPVKPTPSPPETLAEPKLPPSDDEYDSCSSSSAYSLDDSIQVKFVRKNKLSKPATPPTETQRSQTLLQKQTAKINEAKRLVNIDVAQRKNAAIEKLAQNDEGLISANLQEMPDDADGDDEAEFKLWRIRELNRLARDLRLKQEREDEREHALKRHKLTDQEIIDLDPEAWKPVEIDEEFERQKETRPMFHKGAYYVDKL